MTKLLEHAVATARALPPDVQDDIARMVLVMAGQDEAVIPMSAEDEASFAESRAQAAGGEFASDERMHAIWSDDR